MAPHKQPASLYDHAHKSYVTLLHNACVGIQRQHGSYDSDECVQAVQDLQNVLLATVPSSMWNDLCERLLALSSADEHDPDTLACVELRKIAYGLCAHEKLTRITLTSGLASGGFFATSLYDQESSLHFWENIFKNLRKVTKLNLALNGTCTKDKWLGLKWIFDVVYKYCQDLDDLYIPFKLSPKDLEFMFKFPKLRRIDGIYRKDFMFCRFNKNDCKHIVESLPELEYFVVPQVVECFPDLDKGLPLKLTHLIIDNPVGGLTTPAYITLAIELCPNLKHLDFKTSSVQECSAIFESLAVSPLKLNSLSVQSRCPSMDSCQQFFSVKGLHLLNLKFIWHSGITFTVIKLIGEHCLNLKSLHVEKLSSGLNQGDCPTAGDMLVDRWSPIFKNLTTLTINNDFQAWDHRVVKWCLRHATHLETLTLSNLTHEDTPQLLLEDIQDLFATKQLPELVSVTVLLDLMSREMIQCIYENCPKMRQLFIMGDEYGRTELEECVKTLNVYWASTNIDLTISFKHFLEILEMDFTIESEDVDIFASFFSDATTQ